MKLSLFKKVIREVVREEIEYSIKGLRKELKEVLGSSINKNMLEEKTSVTTSKPIEKKSRPIEQRVPMTKDSILNDYVSLINEDFGNFNRELEYFVESTIDNVTYRLRLDFRPMPQLYNDRDKKKTLCY